MRKSLFLGALTLLSLSLLAQDPAEKKPAKKKIDLSNRPNDHFVIQLGWAGWSGAPDSINTGGLSKTINAYFMLDLPFKTNPKLSIGIGAGIGSDHILFQKTNVGIKDATPTMRFTNAADTNHFKKTKLATNYLEAPLELRYSADPETGKGLKFAVGIKAGTLINAHTRNSILQNRSGNTINEYVMKENSKRFFNRSRIAFTGRVGLGHFALFASYQVTPLLRDGLGPQVRPISIGLSLSGL